MFKRILLTIDWACSRDWEKLGDQLTILSGSIASFEGDGCFFYTHMSITFTPQQIRFQRLNNDLSDRIATFLGNRLLVAADH